MKKSFFTILILAVTAQISFSQFIGVTKYPPSLQNSAVFGGTGAANPCGDAPTDATNPIMLSGPDNGYAAGNNSLGDKEKLQKYDIDSIGQITGLIVYLPHVVAAQDTVVYGVIYDVDPATGGPGATRYLTQDYNFNNENMLSYIEDKVVNQMDPLIPLTFDVSPAVDDSFFAGIVLPNLAGDTLVISTTTDGCYSGKDLAWERRSDDSFHKMSATDANGKGLNIDFCIFPVFDYQANWLNRSITYKGITLKGAYPNPAVNTVNLNFAIKNSADVKVEFFDALGRNVISNTLGNLSAGSYSENVDLSRLTCGVYYYSITAGADKMFSKIVVE